MSAWYGAQVPPDTQQARAYPENWTQRMGIACEISNTGASAVCYVRARQTRSGSGNQRTYVRCPTCQLLQALETRQANVPSLPMHARWLWRKPGSDSSQCLHTPEWCRALSELLRTPSTFAGGMYVGTSSMLFSSAPWCILLGIVTPTCSLRTDHSVCLGS